MGGIRNKGMSVWFAGVIVCSLLAHLGGVRGCTCKFSSGNTYTLANFPPEVVTAMDFDGSTYFYQPCNTIVSTQCDGKVGAAICQRESGFPIYNSCGVFTTECDNWSERHPEVSGFTVIYQGGTAGRKTEITFQCSATPGVWTWASEQPQLFYHFNWLHPSGCPSSSSGGSKSDGGLSIGWIIIICLLVSVVLYIVAGVAFQRFYRHESGWDLIPNRELWMGLPFLVKDGHVYAFRKIRSLFSRGYDTY